MHLVGNGTGPEVGRELFRRRYGETSMRKILLATVALLGSSFGGVELAQAQSTTMATLMPSTTPTPAPGTVTVRLGGRVNFFAASVSDSGNRVPGAKQSNYT